MTKIFISHSSKDTDFAVRLAQTLTKMGITVWIDLEDIPAGMKWSTVIQQGLNECEAMIVILSPDAMASRNVEDEWQYYLDKRKKLIPVRWKPVDVHFQLNRIQYIDFYEQEFSRAFAQLISELERQGIASIIVADETQETHSDVADVQFLKTSTIARLHSEDILPLPFELVEVYEGKVVLWDFSHRSSIKGILYDVSNFIISKYPITNRQYLTFVDDSNGYLNPIWWDFSDAARVWRDLNPQPQETGYPGDDIPRTNVTWYEAIAYCRWLSAVTHSNFMLPTEKQWQRAAIGDTFTIYPWGDDFDPNKCNTLESNIGLPTSVTHYPQGASPYGVMDMCGNVWEWCLTNWASGIPSLEGTDLQVLRGGSCFLNKSFATCAYRDPNPPNLGFATCGFRLVVASS